MSEERCNLCKRLLADADVEARIDGHPYCHVQAEAEGRESCYERVEESGGLWSINDLSDFMGVPRLTTEALRAMRNVKGR